MIFTSLMSLWRISYQKFSCFTLSGTGSTWLVHVDAYWLGTIERLLSFLGSRSFSFSGLNKSMQRALAYGCLGLGILFTALIGVNCGGEDTIIGERSKEAEVPAKPTLTAQAGDENVSLFWNRLQNATSYMVYMNDETPREMSGEGNNAEMNFTVDELNNGDIYSFQVAGVNALGEGEKSNAVQMMPRPKALAAVEIIVDNSPFGDQEVILKWAKVEDATHYRIYKQDQDDPFANIDDITIPGNPEATVDTTTYTESGLTNGKYYLYQVEPIMEIPNEEPVLGERASHTGRPQEGQEQRPGVRGGPTNTSDLACSIRLIIRPPSQGLTNPAGYKVEVKDVSDNTDAQDPVLVSKSGTSTTHLINGLAYGKTYKAIVTATAASDLDSVIEGASFQQETSQLTCRRKALSKPNAPAVTISGTLSLRVGWSQDPRATHYKLIRYDADGSARDESPLEKTIAELGGEGNCCSYEDTGLSEGTTYKYALKSVLKIGGDSVLESLESPQGTGRAITLIGGVEPAEYVDPFIGTEYTHGDSYQPSRTFPIASVPFGMVVFTPMTGFHGGNFYDPPNDNGGSYVTTSGRKHPNYVGRSGLIKGFAAFSFQGPGCRLANDFLMMPSLSTSASDAWLSSSAVGSSLDDDFKVKTRRSLRTTAAERKAARDDDNIEWAEAGYYRVKTKSNVLIEITATKRTGMMRITYPSTASTGYFHLASYTQTDNFYDSNSSTQTTAIGGQNVGLEGQVQAGKFCSEGDNFKYTMFLSGQFNRAYSSPVTRSSDDNETKVQFDLSTNKVVIYKFGLSFVSLANARKNMVGYTPTDGARVAGENEGWDFEAIKGNAREAWNTMLGRVGIADDPETLGVLIMCVLPTKRGFIPSSSVL